MTPKQAAIQAARRHFSSKRDRTYFLRQMGAESNFSDATSPAGAQGYAQIMPGTAAAWGVHNVHDPVEAYDAAAEHMAGYLRSYGGSWAKALTAYNAGPGRVGGTLPAETRAYISRILGGKGDATSAGGGGGLTATKHTTLGSTSTDTNGALVDALLAGGSGKVKGSIHQNVLGHALSLVQSGAYTTTTPSKTTVSLKQSGGGASAANGSAPSEHAGTTVIDGKPVANWVATELRWARAHGWKGQVNSGYRSDAEQLRIWNSGVRPAAKPKSLGGGGSNHSGTNFPYGAVDVSDSAQLAAILRNKPGGSRLVWAGAKDPVHFSHPHGGSY